MGLLVVEIILEKERRWVGYLLFQRVSGISLCFAILPSTLGFISLNFTLLFLAPFFFIFPGFLLGFLSLHSSQLHNTPL